MTMMTTPTAPGQAGEPGGSGGSGGLGGSGGSGGLGGRGVVVGIDTHQRTHHAVVLDATGRVLGDGGFAAGAAGYGELMAWVEGLAGAVGAPVGVFGVESTGSYGAGLTRALLVAGHEVVEVARVASSVRYQHGKSDRVDAEAAARQVLAGTASARPKIHDGVVESIRVLKVTRDSAVKHRTAAYSQLRDLATTAPEELRAELLALSSRARVLKAAGYRPDPQRLGEPAQMAKHAMRVLARRIQALDVEVDQADVVLGELVAAVVPSLLALPQVGVQSAAQLVITAGQNIDRMGSQATFAKLTGVAPIPASSGKSTGRMRLNRGGDRQANAAIYIIVIGRLRNHPPTQAYMARRSSENLTKRDLIRCLKRYTSREIYRALRHDLMTVDNP